MSSSQLRIADLRNLDQYARLSVLQQSLDQVRSEEIDQLMGIVQQCLRDGDLIAAAEISDCAVLCAINLDDYIALAETLTLRAKILFASNQKPAGIHCSLEAFHSLKFKGQLAAAESHAFFVRRDFEFGIAVVEQEIARNLGPSDAVNQLNGVKGIYEKYEYDIGLGYLYWDLGDAYDGMNRMEDALVNYLRALSILRSFDMLVVELIVSLSNVYSHLNQLEEAYQSITEAEKIFAEEQNDPGLAAVRLNKAAFMRRVHQYGTLVRQYRQAQETFQKSGELNNIAFIEVQVATLFMFYGAHQAQCVEFLKSAIAKFDEVKDIKQAARARLYLGLHYYQDNTLAEAKELLLPVASMDSTAVYIDTLWQAFYYLGLIEGSEGNLPKAYDYHKKAIEIVDSMRSHLRTEELIVDFIDRKPDFYQPLVTLARRMEMKEDAFAWVEHAKARGFLYILGNTIPGQDSDPDGALLRELNEIDKQINYLEKTILARQSLEPREVVDRWRQRLNEQMGARENLSRKRKIQNSETASLISVQPSDLKELKSVISVD